MKLRGLWWRADLGPLVGYRGEERIPVALIFDPLRGNYSLIDAGGHRLPIDAALVAEVSDTTYPVDFGEMLPGYARAGIPDYWIVHLPENRVEVYRKPANRSGKESDWKYTSVNHLAVGQAVAMLKRPKVRFEVEELLP